MAKTTVKPGNPYAGEGGRMPSTTGKTSGGNRGNNPPRSKQFFCLTSETVGLIFFIKPTTKKCQPYSNFTLRQLGEFKTMEEKNTKEVRSSLKKIFRDYRGMTPKIIRSLNNELGCMNFNLIRGRNHHILRFTGGQITVSITPGDWRVGIKIVSDIMNVLQKQNIL